MSKKMSLWAKWVIRNCGRRYYYYWCREYDKLAKTISVRLNKESNEQ